MHSRLNLAPIVLLAASLLLGCYGSHGRRGRDAGADAGDLDVRLPPGSVPPGELNAVIYGDGLFVAVGSATEGDSLRPVILQSVDGRDWERELLAPGGYLTDVAYGEGLYLAVGRAETFGDPDLMFVSSDGRNWRLLDLGIEAESVAYGNGAFVVVGASLDAIGATRLESSSLTEGSIAPIEVLAADWWAPEIEFLGGEFVVFGDSGAFVTSENGTRWERLLSETTNRVFAMGEVDGVLHASAEFDCCFGEEPDAIRYQHLHSVGERTLEALVTEETEVVGGLQDFVFAGGLGIAGSYEGLLRTTRPAGEWAFEPTEERRPILGVAHGAGVFVAAGTHALVFGSGDEFTDATIR